MANAQVISCSGDTVYRILLEHFGNASDDLENALHELNPKLAKLGPVLPSGVSIILPIKPTPAVKKAVNIWD